MAAVLSRAWLGVQVTRCRVSTATFLLGVGLVWLVIFGAIVLAVPTVSTPANRLALAVETGHAAHLHAPPLTEWPIPVGRMEFDAYNLALDSDDEVAIAKVEAIADWIIVAADQAVLVLYVDGDAVQVELLDGADAGRRGWLKRRHLVP